MTSGSPILVSKLASLLIYVLFLSASGAIWCKSLVSFDTFVSVSPWYLHCLWSVTQPLNFIFRGINKSLSRTATPGGGLANVPLGPFPTAVLTSLPTVPPLPLSFAERFLHSQIQPLSPSVPVVWLIAHF